MNISYSLKGTVVSDGYSTDVTVTVSDNISPGADFKDETKKLWVTANDELEKRVSNMKKRHGWINRMRDLKEQIRFAEMARDAVKRDDLAGSYPGGTRMKYDELRAAQARVETLPAKQKALAEIEADLAANE